MAPSSETETVDRNFEYGPVTVEVSIVPVVSIPVGFDADASGKHETKSDEAAKARVRVWNTMSSRTGEPPESMRVKPIREAATPFRRWNKKPGAICPHPRERSRGPVSRGPESAPDFLEAELPERGTARVAQQRAAAEGAGQGDHVAQRKRSAARHAI